MTKTGFFILLITFVFFLSNCRKDEPDSSAPAGEKGTLSILISHLIDTIPFRTDTFSYRTPSGLVYSISTLRYYLSSFCFIEENGKKYISDSVFYIDANQQSTSLHFPNIPVGHYTQLYFYIGLDTVHNKSGSLTPCLENMNMAWPDAMGGGYHFLKLEGHFINDQSQQEGYAIHLGTNGLFVQHLPIQCSIPVSKEHEASINLEMNINEWFANPYTYDFIKDGNYTMADHNLMMLIRNNGQDVFKLR